MGKSTAIRQAFTGFFPAVITIEEIGWSHDVLRLRMIPGIRVRPINDGQATDKQTLIIPVVRYQPGIEDFRKCFWDLSGSFGETAAAIPPGDAGELIMVMGITSSVT